MLWIKTLKKKGEKENGGLTLFFFFQKRKKNLCFSHIHVCSRFESELGRGTSFFFFFWRVQTPQDGFKLSEGNFTGFLINIQPPSRASPGHFGACECVRSRFRMCPKIFINTAVNDKNSWLTSCDGEAAACILRSVRGQRDAREENKKKKKTKFNN